MLSFTVTGDTAAEISQRLRDAAASFGASTSPPSEAKAEPKKEEKIVQKAESKAEKKAEPKKDAAKPAPEKTASGITLEAVAGKIAEICENKTRGGKDKAREILAKFGAKKGGELKPEQYAAFVADVDALLKPSEGASDDDGLM